MVGLTLAPNEEQLLAALEDGSLWGLDLTRLSNLPVSLWMWFACHSAMPPPVSILSGTRAAISRPATRCHR